MSIRQRITDWLRERRINARMREIKAAAVARDWTTARKLQAVWKAECDARSEAQQARLIAADLRRLERDRRGA